VQVRRTVPAAASPATGVTCVVHERPDRLGVSFDEENLVANAGILLPVKLGQRRGLERSRTAAPRLTGSSRAARTMSRSSRFRDWAARMRRVAWRAKSDGFVAATWSRSAMSRRSVIWMNRPGCDGGLDLPWGKWSSDSEVRGREDPALCLAGTRPNSVVR
jgi:hypothetical protein